MHIYIPTRGRPESQITLESLGTLQKYTHLVIPKSEHNLHKKYNRNLITHNKKGIGSTRQFIMNYAMKHNQKKIIMLDDDLIFSIRANPDKWNLRPVFGRELFIIFKRLEKLLDNYVHATLSPRFMNNVHYPLTEKLITPQRAVHAIRPDILKKHNIKYDFVELMEDHYVTLSLLSLGYPNCMITNAAWDQKGVSNAAGGCSSYRSLELQERTSNKLKNKFPEFVTVVKKKTKTGWNNIGERTDVRIRWQKAYKAGSSIRNSN